MNPNQIYLSWRSSKLNSLFTRVGNKRSPESHLKKYYPDVRVWALCVLQESRHYSRRESSAQVRGLVGIITNVIKAHFPTLSYGSPSSLPPEINHKFTPQLPWRNCLQLQLPYQIIDRILLGPTISDFMCFVGKDLYRSSFQLLSLGLACRVAGTQRFFFSSSVFIHTGLLSEGSAHLSPPVSAHCISKLIAHSDKSCPEDTRVRCWIFILNKKRGFNLRKKEKQINPKTYSNLFFFYFSRCALWQRKML